MMNIRQNNQYMNYGQRGYTDKEIEQIERQLVLETWEEYLARTKAFRENISRQRGVVA